MANVYEIIRLTEERSNDIDIIATIKNAFANFYTKDLEYPFIEDVEYDMPGLSLKCYIREYDEHYELNEIDDIYINEVYKNLDKGIFISMAFVKIFENKCIIHSTKKYIYNISDLVESDEEYIDLYREFWEFEKIIYGIKVIKENDKLKISYCGDFRGAILTPLFEWMIFLNDNQTAYKFNTTNPIVQKVVEAIYNGIIFK